MRFKEILGQILGGVVEWVAMTLFMALSVGITWMLGV